jgi:hypothetical protein
MSNEEHPIILTMIEVKENGPPPKIPDAAIRLTEDHYIYFEICTNLKSMNVYVVQGKPEGSKPEGSKILSKLLAMPFGLLTGYANTFALIEQLIFDISNTETTKGEK